MYYSCVYLIVNHCPPLQESILASELEDTQIDQLTTTSLTTTLLAPLSPLVHDEPSPPVSQNDDIPPAREEHMGDINTNIREIIAWPDRTEWRRRKRRRRRRRREMLLKVTFLVVLTIPYTIRYQNSVVPFKSIIVAENEELITSSNNSVVILNFSLSKIEIRCLCMCWV